MPRPQVTPVPLSVIAATLAAAVATGGTFTASYPLLQPASPVNTVTKNKGHFFGVGGHKLLVNQAVYTYPADFELTFNAPASGITVTWRNATTLAAGSNYKLQLNEMGNIVRDYGGQLFPGNFTGVVGGKMGADAYLLNLGAPITLSTTGVAAAQARAAAGNMTLNGASAISGAVYMDVPRAVDIVSANAGDTTQTATVTGTDFYGQAMSELIAFNGTTRVAGKKAFWKITQIAVSAATAGNISAGTTDVLGLPVFLPGAGYVLKEIQDGAAATAGTFVAGATVTPTTTSADVRGTYVPNAATNGTRALHLIAFLANPGDIGGTQA